MLLGVAGAFVATYLGQAIGWYQPGEGAGLIGAVVGAIVVLVVWGMSRAVSFAELKSGGCWPPRGTGEANEFLVILR